MNTINDEKLEDLIFKAGTPKSDIDEIVEYIHNKTIDECIACVRNDDHDKLNYFAHNSYKLETITNLTNLKNNG